MGYGGGNFGPDRSLSHPKCVKKSRLFILTRVIMAWPERVAPQGTEGGEVWQSLKL